MLDQPERIADRVRAGRARGRHPGVRAFRPEAHRDLSGRKIHQRRKDEERRHAIGSPFEQDLMLALDRLKSADPAPDRHADAWGIAVVDAKPARRERHGGASKRELNEPSTFLEVFLVEPQEGIEALDLAGEACGVA